MTFVPITFTQMTSFSSDIQKDFSANDICSDDIRSKTLLYKTFKVTLLIMTFVPITFVQKTSTL